jgi:hypothetical protein
MPRDGLCLVVGAGLFLACVAAVPAGPPDESHGRIETVLAVQRALQEGRDCMQRGNYQAAVYILESEIARINGDRDYIRALRDAYRGYIRELTQAGRTDDLRLYQSRLQSIDRGARFDDPPAASTPVAAALAGQARPKEDLAAAATPAADKSPATPSGRTGPRSGLTARGAPPDERGTLAGDPFADANRVAPSDSRNLAGRAAEEFSKGHYQAAGRLYEQAQRADPHSADTFREQWAYCKLYAVVETLNRHSGEPQADLAGEVRQALALTSAPKLEAFGKDLLRRIQARTAAGAAPRPVEVHHTPAQGAGWAVAETTNFRVLHRQSREFAEEVARAAEETRSAMSLKWFGDDPPAWTPRCDIWLHATAEDYARETRAPRWSPGHSTIQREGERVTVRRIDLRCDIQHLTDAVIPHETTHQVFCGRFGRHDVPRWADEGVAVLTEPRDRIELHLRNLPMHHQEHTLFPVGQLVKMSNYPDARSIGPFYAGSVSLVEFLSCQAGGPRTFTSFLRDGLDQGYEAALKRHYGIDNFAELQQRWEQHAFAAATAQLGPQSR